MAGIAPGADCTLYERKPGNAHAQPEKIERSYRQQVGQSGNRYNFTLFSRNAFITTVNEDSAIAAPANIGDIRMPETG